MPTLYYLGVRSSWVGTTATVLLNLVYWVLWLGTGYLLFFWKKPGEIATTVESRKAKVESPDTSD
jgi:hypothetical protein